MCHHSCQYALPYNQRIGYCFFSALFQTLWAGHTQATDTSFSRSAINSSILEVTSSQQPYCSTSSQQPYCILSSPQHYSAHICIKSPERNRVFIQMDYKIVISKSYHPPCPHMSSDMKSRSSAISNRPDHISHYFGLFRNRSRNGKCLGRGQLPTSTRASAKEEYILMNFVCC